VDTEGRREIVGLGLGPSEAEPFWLAFLKGLVKRGLKGVKLVISDAHDGLRHAITRVLGATWQRCRVHWIRNALAHVPKGQHTMVAATIRQPSCNRTPTPRTRPGGMSPTSCGRAGPSSPR
jgi:putative transposase